jgi:ADP-ribose pyrophosphatase
LAVALPPNLYYPITVFACHQTGENHVPENPTDLLLETSRFRVVRVTHDLPGGGTKSREVVRHPGAVVILPMVDDSHVCLIRNFRISVNQTLVELPAGTLEPPEPPEITAERELIEETGYRAAKIDFLHAFYLAPGILDEKMHLFVAHGLTRGETAREVGEEIENLVVPYETAISMIFDGTIKDGKTIASLLYYDRLRKK